MSSALIFLLFLFAIASTDAASSSACSICSCFGNDIYCQEKHLPTIPSDLPSTATTLNLKGNNFEVRTLYRSNFTRFRHLTSLSLAKCGLNLINADAFADLTLLTQLDLSSNNLLIIEDGTFAGLNLQNLFLHSNLGLFLSERAFVNASIRHLSMRQCGLYSLEPAVLAPLSDSLEDLILEKNKLKTLDEEIFSPGFPRLKSLSLSGNPWYCSCELRWLKTLHMRNRTMFIQEDLACNSPESVSNFYFASLHLADFECQQPLFEDIAIVFHAERAELSCTVGSEAPTSVSWLTPTGTRHIYQSGAPASNKDGLSTDRRRVTTAKLVVARPPYIQSSVEGEIAASSQSKQRQTYRCIAGNMMGNVSASIEVVWPPPVRIHQASAQKSPNGLAVGNSSDLLMLGENPAICVDTMAVIGAIVGTFAVTLVSMLITLLATRRIRACLRRRQDESGFLHHRSLGHRDAPCWAPVMSTAGKLVGNSTSLRPGSAGPGGAATPLVLNTSSGSSSSSRQSASGGNISNSGGNGTLTSGPFIYHPAHTFHHGGMLSAANNLEELSHFIDTASSPGSGPPMLTIQPPSSTSGGFTFHAPIHKQNMQVSLTTHRNILR